MRWQRACAIMIASGYGTCCTSFGTFLKDYEGTAWNKHDASLKHGESERVFCATPYHPIAEGIPERFDIPKERCMEVL